MNIRKMMSFVAVLIAVLSCASWAAEAQMQPLDVKLSIIGGQVKLTRVGKVLSDVITAASPLFAGDLIETLRESKAELVYGDGTRMRIKPMTMVELQPTALKVFKGQTWFKFVKRGSEFLIETPSLVAGIRGTVFDVAVSSRGKSVLSVVQGAVAVRGKNGSGQEMLVKGGKATSCSVGEELSQAYDFNVEKKNAEWKDADWAGASEADINALYINYFNLKSEYGANDSRTIEAFKRFEEAQKAKALKKPAK
ncbi:FecR domain-containing protein [Candidatus Ozemobacteraceae bacterium]|nr:FecR domain-containing protein [Candidatus Ozemobacteraceae bacterium]OQA08995.1 MAG: FecR protein [bacterium ADurb.Bin374]